MEIPQHVGFIYLGQLHKQQKVETMCKAVQTHLTQLLGSYRYNCIFPENSSHFISREDSNAAFAYARTNALKFLLRT